MKKIKLLMMSCALLGLIASHFYFWQESKKPAYRVMIGKPIDEERTNYGEPVKEKEVWHEIEFALINAVSVEQPEITTQLPDATLTISDWQVGAMYSLIDVWFEEEQVIFAMGGRNNEFGVHYKQTLGDFGTSLKAVIEAAQ